MTSLWPTLPLLLLTSSPVPSESPVRIGYSEGVRPEPHLTVSEWADAYRKLPQRSSAEPGPWRTDRTPYLREIMDALSATSPVQDVVMMFAAQTGKTETLLNVLGYIVDHAPGPTLFVQPTVDTSKRFSKQRVEPLFTMTPRLVGKVAEVRTRDSRGSMLMKEFVGGVLVITGANSAVGLRSMPARYLLLDEIDGYPSDVDDEGDPIGLAEARQRTFARRKTGKSSTPTIAGLSAIEAAYIATDQRRYFVPCPHCGERQVLEFHRLVWSKLELKPEQAVYLCAHCEGRIEERHKTAMLEAGEWRPTWEKPLPTTYLDTTGEKPAEPPSPKVRGYHLSGLYSPVGWLSWGRLAADFVKAHKNPDKLKLVINTGLALTWRVKGEAPEWQPLYDRREQYALGTVPAGGLFLTAGVDVQKDRLIVEIVAWGRGRESWSVDYGILPGNTSDLTESGPWTQLDALMARAFVHEGGTELSVRMLAVDSGYNTQEVYTWARKYPMNRVISIKGMDSGGALLGAPSPVEINLRGRRPIRGYKVWPVVGGIAKSELYGFIRLDRPAEGEPFPPGWCHFPQYDEDYFKQLTAEQLITKKNKRGFAVQAWSLIPGRENHVLDARVYARAAAQLVGLDRFGDSDWEALERMVSGESPPAPEPRPQREPWLKRRG
jgi:phage terminase large subunit GpA-like protein